MNRTVHLVFIAAALASLAGCGNKGPLVLPTAPAEPVIAPDAPAETPTTEPAAEDGTTPPATEDSTTPATDDSTTPPAQPPVPASSDGDGNG
jgi:predicted small lipoprotein YifL